MTNMINMNEIVGSHNILMLVPDTLRYDVAVSELDSGNLPNLSPHLPHTRWEHRHSPGNFTYAAHCAFFAGFLPTPAHPGLHPRLFAVQFPGSETTSPGTYVFDSPDIVSGLAEAGYHTLCIGGVGFFNKKSPLGSYLPGLFRESHWCSQCSVVDPHSTAHQIEQAISRLEKLKPSQPFFLFINFSALHQPNYYYLPDKESANYLARRDTIESHGAALRYIDSQLPPLFEAVTRNRPTFCITCSDHGTAYGEDGFTGHRLAHPSVWDVPYAHFILPQKG